MSYFDISQAEPRSIAYLSGDETMVGIYESGMDLYYYLGAMQHGVSYEEWINTPGAKDTRTKFKVLLLAILYGMGDNTIATSLGIDVEEAKLLRESFYNTFPKMREYIQHKSEYPLKHNGMVETLFGDKIRCKVGESPDKMQRAGINYIVQGGTSLALTAGFYGVIRECRNRNLNVRAALAVHDALINYHRAHLIFDLNKIYREVFTDRIYEKIGVRYEFSVKYGVNYNDLAEVTNVDDDTIKIKGTNKSIIGILGALDQDEVKYEVLEKGSDIVVNPIKLTMNGFLSKNMETVSYGEDESYNKVVIRRIL